LKKQKVQIDNVCYESLLTFMKQQSIDDLKGKVSDLCIFQKDAWLKDSAVIENISLRKGNWYISLVFAYTKFPLQLIQRKITSCNTMRKAEITANYMKKVAAKDPRGTLKINQNDFEQCYN